MKKITKRQIINKLIVKLGGFTKEDYNELIEVNNKLRHLNWDKDKLISDSNKNYEALEQEFKTLKATMQQYREGKYISTLKELNDKVSNIQFDIWGLATELQAMVDAACILDKDKRA